MQPINESIVLRAIQQCLQTADHYIRQGNRRDAKFYLETADAYANRLIFCRQMQDMAAQWQTAWHHSAGAEGRPSARDNSQATVVETVGAPQPSKHTCW